MELVLIGGILVAIIVLIKILISSLRKQPDEHRTMQTTKSVQELENQIKRVAVDLGASIERVEDSSYGVYDETYVIAIVLFGKNRDLIGSKWAVQIYVKDHGNARNIELVALSERANAHDGGIKLSESKAKCEFIASKLK